MIKKNNINKPNKNFDHVYVVLRYDSHVGSDAKQSITVLKVFISESDATAEAERLNILETKRQHDSNLKSEYYVELGRMPKGLLKDDHTH
ncbi:MAG: hypothetical protein ACRC2T_08725 [Thermoguttaceae bacterium]